MNKEIVFYCRSSILKKKAVRNAEQKYKC